MLAMVVLSLKLTIPPIPEAAMRALRADFLADAVERLAVMQQALDEVKAGRPADPRLHSLRRETHNLKGLGGSLGLPFITLVAHRLEDYLGLCRIDDPAAAGDVQTFIDCLGDAVECGGVPGEEDAAIRLRTLPMFRAADIADVDIREVEIMLLTGSRTIARVVGDELRACGYRVVGAANPFQAIALAVQMRPDMVITSAVLEGLSGIDVARALRAMSATADLPVAIMTSFRKDHSELSGLPRGVEVIRLGRFLSDDLAGVLGRFDA
jgi:CheY-like chemotaxis protein/HPt (histidine-containing phosphotransfer) domain-containing protein